MFSRFWYLDYFSFYERDNINTFFIMSCCIYVIGSFIAYQLLHFWQFWGILDLSGHYWQTHIKSVFKNIYKTVASQRAN